MWTTLGHTQSAQLPHNQPSIPVRTGLGRDQTDSCCTRSAVLIASTPFQLCRKSFYVLSPLSEGHIVFQPRLGEQYRVPLTRPGGRCVTLICYASIRPPRPPALAHFSPWRPSRPAVWQDRPTLVKPPLNPSPVEEPKNPLAPYYTSPRHPTLNGTDGLAGAVEYHSTSPYKR